MPPNTRPILTVTAIEDCFHKLIWGKSAHTKKAYRGDMANYFAWAGGENWADAIRELVKLGRVGAREQMNRYRRAKRNDAQATVRRRIAAIQSLVARLRRDDLIDWNLEVDTDTSASKETKKGTSKRDMSGLTPAEMKRLRDVLAMDGSLAGFRDRAMIALLENPMLREHELVSLSVSDVDLEGRRVRIIGKGRDEPEWLKMPAATRDEVKAWLDLAKLKRGTPLFRQIVRYKRRKMNPAWRQVAGQWLTEDGLSTTAVYEMTGARGRAAGLKRRLRPHGLRHTGITVLVADCLKHKKSLSTAQKITRHKRVETLLNYVDPNDDDLDEILERTSKVTR